MKVNGHDQSTRAYVGAFNFKGQDQQKNVGKLSGGERNRVNIAKMLKRGGNVLLLDEPTNDLDVETLGALEEAIENFAGCAVVISHDRFFLDRLATHILAFEGDSHVEWFEGNFQAYEEDKIRRLGEEATRPHRTTLPEADAIEPMIMSRRWSGSGRARTRRGGGISSPCPTSSRTRSARTPSGPRGFGSVKVEATIGDVTWRTSVFPLNSGGYLLPVKAEVRRRAGIAAGDEVTVELELL